MQTRINMIGARLAGIGLALSLAPAAQATFTSTGSWSSSWHVDRIGSDVPLEPVVGDTSGTWELGGEERTTVSAGGPFDGNQITAMARGTTRNTDNGTVPRIASYHQIKFSIEDNIGGGPGSNIQGSTKRIFISSEFTADFSDTITITDEQLDKGKLRLDLIWTGTFSRSAESPTYGAFSYQIREQTKLTVYQDGTEQLATMDYSTVNPSIQTQTNGQFNNYDSDNVVNTHPDAFVGGVVFLPGLPTEFPLRSVLIPFDEDDSTVNLSLNMTDSITVDFDTRADGSWETLEYLIRHDLSNTLVLRLGIEDEFGNLVPGASFTSSSGYSYDSIPEPATGMLLSGILTAMGIRRRRH